MARLIDAEDAILQIERREKLLVGDLFISVDSMKEFIKNRPTVDAEPVKHGKWFHCGDNSFSFKYECSECGEGQDIRTGFCSGCGAKMI